MCLFKKRITNPRYKPTRKNGYNPPACPDENLRYIYVDCGLCHDCRKTKRRNWAIRIKEQLKDTPEAVFFTGTFDNKRLEKMKSKWNLKTENEIATKELRLFLERIRRETGKSVKHWVVTELGENNGRIHIHGIFFCENGMTKYRLLGLLWDKWTAGYKYYGKYVNEKTANYITKYMTKENKKFPNFVGKVLATKGIGNGYFKKEYNLARHKYEPRTALRRTIESYRNEKGKEQALPQYYRTKIWTEEEREKLMLEKIQEKTIWIKGEKYPYGTEQEIKEAENVMESERNKMKTMYGEDWDWIEEIRSKRRTERFKKYRKDIRNGKIKEKVVQAERRYKKTT